jgi:hypothetical protein
MTRDLIARAAAAQAAADADKTPRCKWCGATDQETTLTLAIYSRIGRVLECENASQCHARFEANGGVLPVQGSTDTGDLPESPEAPGTDALDADDHLLMVEIIDALLALHDSGAIPVDLKPETRLGIKNLRAKIRAAL